MKLLLALCFLSTALDAMQDITYTQLNAHHLDSLLALINEQAVHDRDKIVILPRRFRRDALAAGLTKELYFGVLLQGLVVGFKKLFILQDQAELLSVLKDEIRCIDDTRELVASGLGTIDDFSYRPAELNPFAYDDQTSVVMYDGADFTAPELRGKGINQQLTLHSLQALKARVIAQMHAKQASKLLLVYGLTNDNIGRTQAIGKVFVQFLKVLIQDPALGLRLKDHIEHYAFKAFKPSFDDDATECVPLPDDRSIEGAGNILLATFKREGQSHA